MLEVKWTTIGPVEALTFPSARNLRALALLVCEHYAMDGRTSLRERSGSVFRGPPAGAFPIPAVELICCRPCKMGGQWGSCKGASARLLEVCDCRAAA